MKQSAILSILITTFLFYGNAENNVPKNSNPVEVIINPEITFQTIHNFGASDAWSCQFVGNWPDKQKNHVADLLFSLETKEDGSPRGIGLSCWRFNIGGGSTDQIGETKIGDPWRRSECFLQDDGSYNWEKQSGQRWFLKAAKERGVESFLGFVNSPPVWLTKNGRANSDGGNSTNLKAENFDAFSEFLVEVTQNIQKNDGILFDYLSPFNEPQWDWLGGQEGTPWTNTEMATFCRLLGNDLKKAGLSTQISITEAGKLTHLFDRGNDSERGFQTKQFFSPESENYVGDVPNMAHKIAGHSYFTAKSERLLNLIRSKLNKKIQNIDPSLEFWMSEYCVLSGDGKTTGGGRDLGMETALFVANIIHADLAVANASAWQWWIAVSPYDFKDGLVYIDKSETGGNVYDSKLLWALGNYSRFIRPGAKRIDVETSKNTKFKTSAYKNENGELVIVFLNRDDKTKTVLLSLPDHITGKATIYETSEDHNLTPRTNINISKPVILPKQSVSTLVIAQ